MFNHIWLKLRMIDQGVLCLAWCHIRTNDHAMSKHQLHLKLMPSERRRQQEEIFFWAFCQTFCVHARNNLSFQNLHELRSQSPTHLMANPTIPIHPMADPRLDPWSSPHPPHGRDNAEPRRRKRIRREEEIKEKREDKVFNEMTHRRKVLRLTLTQHIAESQLILWP